MGRKQPERLDLYVIYGSPDHVKEKIREFSEAGIEYPSLNVYAEREEAMVKLFVDEVISSLSRTDST